MRAPSDSDPLVPHAVTARGRGSRHFLLVPGLVPDGPETFYRQQSLLRKHGWTTTLTYPYEAFDLDAIADWIQRWIDATAREGRKPVLVGCSIGGGICIEVLRRAREAGRPAPITGLILVSPFSCMDDLAPLLRRMVAPIIAEIERSDGKPEVPLERSRQFFKSLAARALAEGRRDAPELGAGWRSLFALLTPQGLLEYREEKLRRRIERTLDGIPTQGGLARVVALRRFRGIDGKPLTEAPALVLWGSKERQTLSMDGPGTAVLCRPDLAFKSLPQAEIQWVYDTDGGEVPHASLIKHARAFNTHLRRFLARTGRADRSVARRVGGLVGMG